MKNPSLTTSPTVLHHKNRSKFKPCFYALFVLLAVLSCKTGGGDPSPDRVEAACLLKFEKFTSTYTSIPVQSGGYETTYQTDNQSRLILAERKETDSDGSLYATKTMKYAYDSEGFLTSIVTNNNYEAPKKYNRTLTKTFKYADGRLVSDEETGPNEPLTGTYTVVQKYAYDSKGDLTQKTYKITGSTGETSETVTTYANGQAVKVKGSGGFAYELNPKGLLIKTKTPSGTEFNEYNAKGELTKTEVLKPDGSKLYANTYEYANIGVNFNEPSNSFSFKGFPTEPSILGKISPIAKQENFFVNNSGSYDRENLIVNTYKLDGRGNILTKTEAQTVQGGTVTYTRNYTYEGCQ